MRGFQGGEGPGGGEPGLKPLRGRFRVSVSLRPEAEDIDGFDQMGDEEIVSMAQNGSSSALEYLLVKYKNFVRAKARSYFLIGAEREDIIQEGMLGLYKATRDFRSEKLSSFRAFA